MHTSHEPTCAIRIQCIWKRTKIQANTWYMQCICANTLYILCIVYTMYLEPGWIHSVFYVNTLYIQCIVHVGSSPVSLVELSFETKNILLDQKNLLEARDQLRIIRGNDWDSDPKNILRTEKIPRKISPSDAR